jgi:hypothetical protein
VSQRRGVDVRYGRRRAFNDQPVDCVRQIGVGDTLHQLATVQHGSAYLSPPAAQRAVSPHPPRYRTGFALRHQESAFGEQLAGALRIVSNAGITPRRGESLAFRARGLYGGFAREDSSPWLNRPVRGRLPDERQRRDLRVGRRHMVSDRGSVRRSSDGACLSFDDRP